MTLTVDRAGGALLERLAQSSASTFLNTLPPSGAGLSFQHISKGQHTFKHVHTRPFLLFFENDHPVEQNNI